jgi:hypothetical protein
MSALEPSGLDHPELVDNRSVAALSQSTKWVCNSA